MFSRALVREPAANFSQGLTTSGLGAPDFERAVKQHAAYCAALERCGLTITKLGPDSAYPDSTFVEDTAILTERGAILTRPGAPSRRGEVASIRTSLENFFSNIVDVEPPGTIDGGDVCAAGNHFFIGVSDRTNHAGAQALAARLASWDYTSSRIDIRDDPQLLHLKSGLAYLGDNCLVVIESLASRTEFSEFNLVVVENAEHYAANCIRVNRHLLVAEGYPNFAEKVRALGYPTIALEMSEFQKMDGGLSCLSLRW